MYKTLHTQKVIYERWIAAPELSIATGAGGTVALTTVANAATISGLSDFSSLANLYTAYRCKAIRARAFPYLPVPVYTGAAVTTMPAVVAIYPWTTNNVPTTFAQAQDVSGVIMASGYKGWTCMNSWKGDPDAHLWTATGSAIGSNEQFGISCVGTALASTATTTVYRVLVDYLVEFRMAG